MGGRIIMDVAHNPDAMARLIEHLEPGPYVGVVGILADKDYAQMLAQLSSVCERLYLTPLDSPRSWQPAKLAGTWPQAVICASPDEAFAQALATGRPIIITGSFLTVGSLRERIICQG